jgi:hypothetical protein
MTGCPSLDQLEVITSRVAERVVYRSFLSMMVRSEALDQFAGAEEAIEEGFHKELFAGQVKRPDEHGISYQCMDPDNYHPHAYSIYYEPNPWWLHRAKGFVGRLASKLEKLPVLFPQVQRRKNMSRDTCRELYEGGYKSDRPWYDYRTLDLELYKVQTGVEAQGNCEMRMSWGYNILKPRFYYATGGSNYWRSRYMKKFAVLAMECVDSTQLKRRMDPTQISFSLDPDDWLSLWDLTSFTTQLSELKHFLYYVSKALSEDLRVQQRPLQLLDYADGVMKITADKFLQVYNEGENYEAPYSVYRVIQKIYHKCEEGELLYQQNSGMLGVPGNIGLSTAFHGFHLEAAVKEGTGCSVGDDALGATKENPKEKLIPHIQLIGELQEEKVTIMPPMREYDYEQIGKFLKRRFSRTQYGVELGLLFAFPSFAPVFNVEDGYHTLQKDDLPSRIAKFTGQVGSFFWDLHAIGFLDPDDKELLRVILSVAYRKLDLNPNGSLPGRKHKDFTEHMMFAVPPIYFDPTTEDWAEYLWDHTNEKYAELPISLGPSLIPDFQPFLEFEANAGGLINVLEDVGCIEKLRLMTQIVEVDITNRRLFRSFLSCETRAYRCRYTVYQPPWFRSVFSDERLDRVPIHDIV